MIHSIKYIIKFLRLNTKIVTKYLIKSSNFLDILSIPISSEDYINELKNITQEQIYNIMFPEFLSPLQQEFKSWHDKLSHIHPKSMFILEKLGFLPPIFTYLKDCVPFFVSWILETEGSRKWITKRNKSGSIRKYSDNKQGYGILVDQLRSAQSVLVTQLSGKITSERIWDYSLIVEHFSDLTYVHIIISTIQ